VIRNAGGVITDDEIRSLTISQRLLGTEAIMLIHHTDCGMLTFSDDGLREGIQSEMGIKPAWSPEAFDDVDADVRQSIARIKASPFIPKKDNVRGFVYDVETGSRPPWNAQAFEDLDVDVRDSIERIRESPFVPRTDSVRGFVYEVETGRLREVS